MFDRKPIMERRVNILIRELDKYRDNTPYVDLMIKVLFLVKKSVQVSEETLIRGLNEVLEETQIK